MIEAFILVLIGLTSVGAYLIGAKGLGLSRGAVSTAILKTLECGGVMFVFLIGNVAASVIVVLAVRIFTRKVVSLYMIGDEAFLVLSLLQGLAFQWWREIRPQGL